MTYVCYVDITFQKAKFIYEKYKHFVKLYKYRVTFIVYCDNIMLLLQIVH